MVGTSFWGLLVYRWATCSPSTGEHGPRGAYDRSRLQLLHLDPVPPNPVHAVTPSDHFPMEDLSVSTFGARNAVRVLFV